MSSPALPNAEEFDTVTHPTLGPLKFPKDMSPDDRNASIVRMMAMRSQGGLSPESRALARQPFFRQMEDPNTGEITTAQDRARNSAYEQLPLLTKAKLMLVPGAYDKWSSQFYGGQLATDSDARAYDKMLRPTIGEVMGGAADIAGGDIARGGHRVIAGGSLAALPLATRGALAEPLIAARAVAGGYLASKATQAGAQALGANPEQQQFSGDIGNLAGGTAAATGLARAVLESPAKALLQRAGAASADILDPEITGIISPRLAHLQRLLSRMSSVSDGKLPPEIASLSTSPREVRGPFQLAADRSVSPSGNIDLPPQTEGGLVRTVPADAGSLAGLSSLPEKQPFALSPNRTVTPSGNIDIPPRNPGGIVSVVPEGAGSLAGQSVANAEARAPFSLHPDRSVTPVKPNVVIHDVPSYTVVPEKITPQNLLAEINKRALPEFQVIPGEGTSVADQPITPAPYKPQSFFRQYPAPEQPPAASPSEIRAASSPNPPRSNLAKNQRQMAAYKASQQPPPDVQLGPGAEGLGGTTRSINVNGQPVGSVTYEIKGDTAVIHNIGGPRGEGGYDVMKNMLGTKGALAIRQQLIKAHPEIKTFEGIRTGGARGEEGRSVRYSM